MFIHLLPPFSQYFYLRDVAHFISWRKKLEAGEVKKLIGKTMEPQWRNGRDQGSFILKAIALGHFKHSLKNKKELKQSQSITRKKLLWQQGREAF